MVVKTISEQLREYFEMVPPSKEQVAKVRKNWRKIRKSSVMVDIATDDRNVTDVLATQAENDNKIEGRKKQ